jgi:hypothetical protein
VQRGEIFGAGRHYLGLATAWKITELLSLNASVITNLIDPSAVIVPVLEYWLEQSVIVRAGGFVPIGARPGASGLKSEYGASPAGLFLQAGLYF